MHLAYHTSPTLMDSYTVNHNYAKKKTGTTNKIRIISFRLEMENSLTNSDLICTVALHSLSMQLQNQAVPVAQ